MHKNSFNRTYGASSHENPQFIFWLRNNKMIFNHTLLSGGLGSYGHCSEKTCYLEGSFE